MHLGVKASRLSAAIFLFQELAALCRDAATVQRFKVRFHRGNLLPNRIAALCKCQQRLRMTDRLRSRRERPVVASGGFSVGDARHRHSSNRSRHACRWATGSRRPPRPPPHGMTRTRTVSFSVWSSRNADTSRPSICWNAPKSRCRNRTSRNETRKSAWRKGSGAHGNLKRAEHATVYVLSNGQCRRAYQSAWACWPSKPRQTHGTPAAPAILITDQMGTPGESPRATTKRFCADVGRVPSTGGD